MDAECVTEALGDEERVNWDGEVEGEGEGVAECTPEWVLNGGDPVGPVLPLGEMEGVAEVCTEADTEVLLDADGVNWEAVVEGDSEEVLEPAPERVPW